jgi:membrane-bound lytic murein transglycosylase MltF
MDEVIARSEEIGISDVTPLENNIHAAAKYLALLRDRHFSDPGISLGDQTRFTLAAYKAGPDSIALARKVAAGKGLDPNRWFDNVEITAWATAGQDTIEYVGNIDKYYAIYQLAEAGEEPEE